MNIFHIKWHLKEKKKIKDAAMISFAQHWSFDSVKDLTNEVVRWIKSDQSEVSTLVSGFYLTCSVSDVQSCQKIASIEIPIHIS